MSFREGWYLVRTDHARRRFCRYFISTTAYTAECIIEPNGEQILLWHVESNALARRADWSGEYRELPAARNGDWWDNPASSVRMRPDAPGDYSRVARKPTARELSQRARSADIAQCDGLDCSKEIHVGIFFDGTNNNRDRDRPDKGHSNIVSLWDAHRDDRNCFFRFYVPGIGTPFPQIGEHTEDDGGKTYAQGGEARIHWAMLLVYNAVSRAVTGGNLLPETEMTSMVTSVFSGLGTVWRLGDQKMLGIFNDIDARLMRALEGRRPRVTRVNLSIFGFSRGAAEARTMCNWIQRATRGRVGNAALNLRFLGIFDTVASVGLADSSPVGRGLLDWADGNLGVEGVQRAVHYAAAHEIRRSFPLSAARGDNGDAVRGVSEYVYPGAHSDVGGGYSPGDQGKSVGARSKLLSQIPLNDMYQEALNAGVELFRMDQMRPAIRADFAIDPELDRAFSAYVRWTAAEEKDDLAGRPTEVLSGRMQSHMQLYWRWRASIRGDEAFRALRSYQSATAQDRMDLWEAEGDFRRDIENARKAAQPRKVSRRDEFGVRHEVVLPPNASALQRSLLKEVERVPGVPKDVHQFFDQYVHDSHAGFWLLGPQTRYDRKVFVAEILRKQKLHAQYMSAWNMYGEPSYLRLAHLYALNSFEAKVVAANGKENTGTLPVITDADAEDLRDRMGLIAGAAVKYGMGTATRREAGGHAQYRRVMATS